MNGVSSLCTSTTVKTCIETRGDIDISGFKGIWKVLNAGVGKIKSTIHYRGRE